MTHKVTTTWKDNMLFDSDNPSGHHIAIDATKDVGGEGSGLSPKALMLSALSGCTGLDVVSLFKKMRVEAKAFYIEVEAELTDEHPKYYKSVTVNYHVTGTNLPKDKVEKAVNLSVERYCGVIEMFRHFAEVKTNIIYHEA